MRVVVAKMLFSFHQLRLMAFGIVLLAGHNLLLSPLEKKKILMKTFDISRDCDDGFEV